MKSAFSPLIRGIMANPEHVEILKHGGEVWTRWREEKHVTRVNFAGERLALVWT